MKKVCGVLLVVLLGACDAAPERITTPGEPRRGGGMLGSGNLTDAATPTADSTATTTMDVVTSETQCVEERGGHMLGSGNRVDASVCPAR